MCKMFVSRIFILSDNLTPVQLCTMCVGNISCFNFRSLRHLRNFFNNENFSNYGVLFKYATILLFPFSQYCFHVFYAGAYLQYCTIIIAVWWFFHVASIFYATMFPFTARRRRKQDKYFAFILSVIGTCLSFI